MHLESLDASLGLGATLRSVFTPNLRTRLRLPEANMEVATPHHPLHHICDSSSGSGLCVENAPRSGSTLDKGHQTGQETSKGGVSEKCSGFKTLLRDAHRRRNASARCFGVLPVHAAQKLCGSGSRHLDLPPLRRRISCERREENSRPVVERPDRQQPLLRFSEAGLLHAVAALVPCFFNPPDLRHKRLCLLLLRWSHVPLHISQKEALAQAESLCQKLSRFSPRNVLPTCEAPSSSGDLSWANWPHEGLVQV